MEDSETYRLTVPLVRGDSVGAKSRYSCCKRAAFLSHSPGCTEDHRVFVIERALHSAGFEFTHECDAKMEDTELTGVQFAEVREEDRVWLAEFLNHAPYIDPHDDDEEFVEPLAKYARFIRTCVEARDYRASLDKQEGDTEPGPLSAPMRDPATVSAVVDAVAGTKPEGMTLLEELVSNPVPVGELMLRGRDRLPEGIQRRARMAETRGAVKEPKSSETDVRHTPPTGVGLPLTSGRMSAAEPNLGNGPKGREDYESPEMRKYGHPPEPVEGTASFVRLLQGDRVLAEFPLPTPEFAAALSAVPLDEVSVRITSMEHVADEDGYLTEEYERSVGRAPEGMRSGPGGDMGRPEEGGLMELGGKVDHPKHYNDHPAGIECVDVNEWMTANIAAAVKYVWRAGLKPDSKHDRDLASAVWYIERERQRLKMVPKNTAAFGGGERRDGGDRREVTR